MELKHYIGAKIKEYRKDNKMTQQDLADRLNTTKQTIGRYEKGARKVEDKKSTWLYCNRKGQKTLI